MVTSTLLLRTVLHRTARLRLAAVSTGLFRSGVQERHWAWKAWLRGVVTCGNVLSSAFHEVCSCVFADIMFTSRGVAFFVVVCCVATVTLFGTAAAQGEDGASPSPSPTPSPTLSEEEAVSELEDVNDPITDDESGGTDGGEDTAQPEEVSDVGEPEVEANPPAAVIEEATAEGTEATAQAPATEFTVTEVNEPAPGPEEEPEGGPTIDGDEVDIRSGSIGLSVRMCIHATFPCCGEKRSCF